MQATTVPDPQGRGVWESRKDPGTARVYWVNHTLKETKWHPPAAPAGHEEFCFRPDTFYHATSAANALRIQEQGFKIPDGRGGLLGRGIYCTSTLRKAMDYLKGQYGGTILELKIDLGNCRQLVPNDPMMKTWQQHGYDSAWTPFSAANPADRGKEENCIKDPSRIKIIKIARALAGDIGLLRQGGYLISDDGKLKKVSSLSLPVSPSKQEQKRTDAELAKAIQQQFQMEQEEARKKAEQRKAARERAEREKAEREMAEREIAAREMGRTARSSGSHIKSRAKVEPHGVLKEVTKLCNEDPCEAIP